MRDDKHQICGYSNKQLSDDVISLNAYLSAQKLHRAKIGILGPNSVLWFIALCASIISDNVAVLLDKKESKEKLIEEIKKTNLSLLFYSPELHLLAKEINKRLKIKIICFEDIKSLIKQQYRDLKLPLDTDALAIIAFTSGTTGNSKAVMLSQYNVLKSTVINQRDYFMSSQVSFLPFSHLYCFASSLLLGLFKEKKVLINRDLRDRFLDIYEFKPESLCIVPLLVDDLYNYIWQKIKENHLEKSVNERIIKCKKYSLSKKRKIFKDVLSLVDEKLKVIYCGGAPANTELIKKYASFGIEIRHGYGVTECSGGIMSNSSKTKYASVGKLGGDWSIKIRHEKGEKSGEILIKGPGVMLGYYKNKKDTKKVLKDGYFCTGDKGYLDKDGYLYIIGRYKNLIILSNGENVSPEELETKLLDCQLINDVVVYQKDDAIASLIYSRYPLNDDNKNKIRQFIYNVNKSNPVYRRISLIEFTDKPFIKNALSKVQRGGK